MNTSCAAAAADGIADAADMEEYKLWLSRNVVANARLPQYEDCSTLLKAAKSANETLESGAYEIGFKFGLSTSRVRVRCDMETLGGGWTVFQRRGDFENPPDYFQRPWNEYERGFGDENGEFWLGLDVLAKLTRLWRQELLVEMWREDGTLLQARYARFALGADAYRLDLESYNGTHGDALNYSIGEPFSTFDADHDGSDHLNCAYDQMSGGWWYGRNCAPANLNGESVGQLQSRAPSNRTVHFKGMLWNGIRVISTEMKIRYVNLQSECKAIRLKLPFFQAALIPLGLISAQIELRPQGRDIYSIYFI